MKKILIILGNPTIQESIERILQEILSQQEYEILQTSGILEGIELIKKHLPRLVIVMFKLPKGFGLETVRFVKLNFPSKIKTIILGEKEDEIISLAAGTNVFSCLGTPDWEKTFKETIVQLLNHPAPP